MEIKMRNTAPVITKKQLDSIMEKTARGIITQVSSYAKKALQYATKRYLYDEDLVGTSSHFYDRSRYLYGSIQNTRTESSGDSFYSNVEYNQDYLMSHAEKPEFKAGKKRGKKRLVKFGRYTDIYGNYVGDEMIESLWLEDGTENRSIVPRRGSFMVEQAQDLIEQYMRSNNIEVEIKKELGSVVVERFL